MTRIQKCTWVVVALLGASGAMAQQRLGAVPDDKLTDAHTTYDNQDRPYMALDSRAPFARAVVPSSNGRVVASAGEL